MTMVSAAALRLKDMDYNSACLTVCVCSQMPSDNSHMGGCVMVRPRHIRRALF